MKKNWVWYSTHVKSPSPKRVQRLFVAPIAVLVAEVQEIWSKMSRHTQCNFWTNRATEDCDHSKRPELSQDFKFLVKKNSPPFNRPILPDLLLPKAKIEGPGAPQGSLQLSSSFGVLVFAQKPIIWRVGQNVLKWSARANAHVYLNFLHKAQKAETF